MNILPISLHIVACAGKLGIRGGGIEDAGEEKLV